MSRLGAFGFVFIASTTLSDQTAAALDCAPHPHGSPQAIASGTEVLATRDRFFDRFDFAVIGTVVNIETVGEGNPNYGATAVTVAVAAVLGDAIASPTLCSTNQTLDG